MKTTYSANNSGGSWWLSDDDWKALEAAGWKVDWYANDLRHTFYTGGRCLGALATSATREGLYLDEAIEEFERITGLDADEEGCSCCGPPHYFSFDNTIEGYFVDGKEVEA